jgi:hypothetical protein
MASTTQDIELPEAPRAEPPAARSHPLRTVVIGAGAVAAIAAAAALAAVTLRGGDENKPVGHPLIAEHGSIRAHEGTVEDPAVPTSYGAPGCMWTTEVDTPVLPSDDLGGPPTPQSVLVFERCNGSWTGNITWLNPSTGSAAPGRR